MQYRINEDGDIVRATLRDNLNRQLRNQLERNISSALSVTAPTKYESMIAKYNPRYEEDKVTDPKEGVKTISVFRFHIPDLNVSIQFNPKRRGLMPSLYQETVKH